MLLEEINLGADGLPIGVPNKVLCPACHVGVACCTDPLEGYSAEFYCRYCDKRLTLSEILGD